MINFKSIFLLLIFWIFDQVLGTFLPKVEFPKSSQKQFEETLEISLSTLSPGKLKRKTDQNF